MDVSIIIVSYNTKVMTKNCIDSIFQYTHDITFEVIVVDNLSSDGSQELLKKDNRILFIQNTNNDGFGKANNIGYRYAKGKYVFLLNSDTLLFNNAVKHFFDYAEKAASNIACFGGQLLNYKMQPMHSFGVFPNLKNMSLYIISHYIPFIKKILYTNNTSKEYFTVDYITGADLFIRKDIIEKHSLFDPDFFMYYEETDMQYRYHLCGYKSLFIPDINIIHLQGSQKKKKSLKSLMLPIPGSFLYFKKHFPKYKYIIIRSFFLIIIPKILIYPGSFKEKISSIKLLFK